MSSRRARKGARRIAVLTIALLTVPIMSGGRSVLAADPAVVPAGSVLRVSVPEAIGGKTVVGQLTVDRVASAGYVAACGCAHGIPGDAAGISRSDLNFDGHASPAASNRLIVKADDNGDVCFYTYKDAAIVVDVNGVSFDPGITSSPTRRVATRQSASPLVP